MATDGVRLTDTLTDRHYRTAPQDPLVGLLVCEFVSRRAERSGRRFLAVKRSETSDSTARALRFMRNDALFPIFISLKISERQREVRIR